MSRSEVGDMKLCFDLGRVTNPVTGFLFTQREKPVVTAAGVGDSPEGIHTRRPVFLQEKMRIRTVLFVAVALATVPLFFIARRLPKRPVEQPRVAQAQTLPRRESVTLRDRTFTYHLDLSRYLLEFPYLQNYSCSTLLAPRTETPDNFAPPLLLLAVKSHPVSFARRSALRKTWAREAMAEGYRVRPLFLMAASDHLGCMELVRWESEDYGDIIQWDFTEGHHNLSLKDRCFLEWLHVNASHVDFIFKGDDDEYVNPPALVRYIKEHGTPYVLHGALQRHAAVQRHSKYKVSWSLYRNVYYPYFLSGGGFLFPGPSVRLLHRASQKLPVFPLDDVYFGFLVLAANLTLRHEERFYVWGLRFSECGYKKALVVHSVFPDMLLFIWTRVQKAVCEEDESTTR
ncbi:beta-1,3-galactosyltransferase 5-like [Gastrophryne carolinensis]